jgi:hypothetical protein
VFLRSGAYLSGRESWVEKLWLSEIFRDSLPYLAAIVSRIANPTIWRVTTLILREPKL